MSEFPDRMGDPTLNELLRRLVPAYRPARPSLPTGTGASVRIARARRAGPDSDYDLLLVVPDDAPPERRRARLAFEALRGTGIAADVVVWTHGAFEERLGVVTSLPATVAREGWGLLGE